MEELISNATIFRGISASHAAILAKSSHTKILQPGSSLMFQGLVGDDLHIITSGKLSVYVKGGTEAIETLAAGDCVGEMSLINPGKDRSATVVASEASATVYFRQFALQELFKNDSSVAALVYQNISKLLAERLRKANEKLGRKS